MKAAEKEVELMEKQVVKEAEQEGRTLPPGEIKLPMFKELQAKKRAEAKTQFLEKRAMLEQNIADIKKQIEETQKALRNAEGVQTIDSFFGANVDLSEEMTTELANIIARLRSQSVATISDEFLSQFPRKGSKKAICSKIESIGVKETRSSEGDEVPVWHLRSEYTHLLTRETKAHLDQNGKGKKRKVEKLADGGKKKSAGAPGPGGEFHEFPEYDATDKPHENKKAFTLFCKSTRKEVKKSLSESERKNRVGILVLFVCTQFFRCLTFKIASSFFHRTMLIAY